MVWIHASAHTIKMPLRDISQQHTGFKPNGMWFGYDHDWIEWMKAEMPEWYRENKYLYKCNLKRNINVLHIKTLKQLEQFIDKYGINKKFMSINWPLVAKEYDGIMFTNYHTIRNKINRIIEDNSTKFDRYIWYQTYDIDSMCIWKPSSVVSSLTLI